MVSFVARMKISSRKVMIREDPNEKNFQILGQKFFTRECLF